ncbi:YesL family protein [Jeotgalibaca caeni]|uniref:YesL family protein n=1 Tax=Jeotgalibaca caeni TaxID=3028623 RepID=UPI00237E2FBF|nr:DUF624 domain-containing protein [Jeotgalibaca caeni]MDE1548941.1 DUF624 domain-containing protein [Jeotgalibaca caeni]
MFQSKMGIEFLEKMNRIADFLIISILWFLFSLPVLTIGASTSALYRTVQTSVVEGKGEVLLTFWKSFKNSFIQALPFWLFYVLLLFIFSLNQLLLLNNLASSWVNQFSQIFIFLLLLFYTPVLLYALAYLSRFKDNLKTIGKNSLFLAVAHFKNTLYVFFLFLLTCVLIYLIPILIVILPAYFTYKICPRVENIFSHYIVNHLVKEVNGEKERSA